ncbi:MAG: hypothetical protein AAF563_05650 [Pseudomonadota bacterium]
MGGLDNRMRALIGAVILLAVAAAAVAMRQDVGDNVTGSDPSVVSISAIGKGAFYELLEDLDIPVDVDRGRGGSLGKQSDDLRVVTGRPVTADNRVFVASRLVGDRMIVILPKWDVVDDPIRAGWVADATGMEVDDVVSMLRMVVSDGKIVRPPSPVDWTINELGLSPTLTQPQLFASSQARPVLGSDDGMLIGEVAYGDRRIWVVADPDFVANHGLHRGSNAALAVTMIEAMAPADGQVVFDLAVQETIEPISLTQLLFEFPTAIVTIQTAIVLLLLLWAITGSFGTRYELPRPLQSGSAALIGNMSALLILGGHFRDMLTRYAQATVRDVAHRLHAPAGLDRAARDAWLERVADARGISRNLERLNQDLNRTADPRTRPDARRTIDIAAAFHQWRQEMIRGPRDDR